jgi:hypothetical protein
MKPVLASVYFGSNWQGQCVHYPRTGVTGVKVAKSLVLTRVGLEKGDGRLRSMPDFFSRSAASAAREPGALFGGWG